MTNLFNVFHGHSNVFNIFFTLGQLHVYQTAQVQLQTATVVPQHGRRNDNTNKQSYVDDDDEIAYFTVR